MAGGTGGHIFPALAVAQSLQQQGHNVVWLGSHDSMEQRLVPQHNIPLELIAMKGVRGKGLLRKLALPLMLLRCVQAAKAVIRKHHIDAVIGFGGFVTFPGGLAAKLLGVPIFVHEQNAVAGMANKRLAKWAARVLYAFPQAFPQYPDGLVGNPVRADIAALPAPESRFAERQGSLKIAIVGGSLGAQVLNETVPAALALLPEAQRPRITHQSGRGNLATLQAAYQQAGVDAECIEFVDDMVALYREADVLICRAGALTIAELTAPVVTWAAWPFHRAAFRALRHGAFTMDTLVSLGVIAATGWSLWALIWGGAGEIGMRMTMELMPRHQGHAAHMYFESAAWVTTFLLAGRYAEARARYRSGDALRALLELGAKEATRVRLTSPSGSTAAIDVLDDDGAPRADAARTEERVPVDALQPGDLLAVRPGEKIATDGVVVEGRSAVDASMLTGESVPVEVGISDAVTGGCVNTFGSLLVRATAVGAGTTLARIGEMVTAAQAGKASVQRLADRVSGVFVPAVLVVSAMTLAVWLGLGYPAQQALTAAVAVLVIACPCALGLATPTALLVGSGRAARLGVVIKGPEVLESSRALDTIVLDKTGTVTRGRMSLELADDDAITVAGGPDSPSNRENLGGPDGADSPGSGNDGNGPDGVDSPGCADSPGYAEGAESTHSTASTDRFEALRLAGALEAASEHPVAAAIAQAARAAATEGTTRADITDDAGNPDNADNAANADNPDNPNKPGNPDNTDIADIPDIPSIPDIAAGTTGTGSASASATPRRRPAPTARDADATAAASAIPAWNKNSCVTGQDIKNDATPR